MLGTFLGSVVDHLDYTGHVTHSPPSNYSLFPYSLPSPHRQLAFLRLETTHLNAHDPFLALRDLILLRFATLSALASRHLPTTSFGMSLRRRKAIDIDT